MTNEHDKHPVGGVGWDECGGKQLQVDAGVWTRCGVQRPSAGPCPWEGAHLHMLDLLCREAEARPGRAGGSRLTSSVNAYSEGGPLAWLSGTSGRFRYLFSVGHGPDAQDVFLYLDTSFGEVVALGSRGILSFPPLASVLDSQDGSMRAVRIGLVEWLVRRSVH